MCVCVCVCVCVCDSPPPPPPPLLQSAVQSELVSIQPHFKQNLLEAVDVYKVDIEAFSESYSKVCV